jgi:cell pole-organizing protein PopZ
MEEILASIRRIIADDQASSQAEAAPAAPERPPLPPPTFHDRSPPQRPPFARSEPVDGPEPAPDLPSPPRPAEVFGLHRLRPSVQAASAQVYEPALAPETPTQALRAVPPAAATLAPAADAPAPHRPGSDMPLVSAETDAAVASSFNALLASQLLQNSGMIAEISRELLRPMLKAWLDDNLPVIVERLVRAEIERVARGAR